MADSTQGITRTDANTDKEHSFTQTAPDTQEIGSTMKNTVRGPTSTPTGTRTRGSGHRTNAMDKDCTRTRRLALG